MTFNHIYYTIIFYIYFYLTMRLFSILVFIALGVIPSQGHYTPPIDYESRDKHDLGRLIEDIQTKVFQFLDKREAELHARNESTQCTSKNIVFRRE